MTTIDRCFLKVFSVFRTCQVICIFAMSILVFLQVVLREIFSVGVQWVYEFSCFMQVTMVWLGVPILLFKDSNIKISMLYNVFPAPIRRFLDFLRYAIYLCCAVFMAFGYVMYVQNLGIMRSSVLRMPNYVFFGAMFFGITMTILVMIFKARRLLGFDKRSSEELEAALREV